ncbi:MAG: magnesium transporter CorA family protein [Neisseriaceae bacterium]|nr:magnesium transporter CorA family protein [Neisseriaceae bacterium]
MLQTYHPQHGWQSVQTTLPTHGWLKLINPSKEEIHQVAQQCQIATELIQASLDPTARPRIVSKNQAHLVLTHLPLPLAATERAPFAVMPMSIIVKDQLVLTVCQQDSQAFHDVVGQSVATEPARLVAQLLAAGAEYFFNALNKVEKMITTVEQELQKSIKNRQVFKLLNHNKSLIGFANSLASNVQVLNGLCAQSPLPSSSNTHNTLLDVKVATEQAHAIAATHSANLRNLMDAYSAAIENNLSLVVQYLSIYVIIMAVPMGIAGLYGMNTPLPLQDEPYILALLAVIGIVVASLITRAFKARSIL